MMKKMGFVGIALLFVIVLIYSLADADTVYLKNGGKISGVIVRESKNNVVIDIGSGTVIHSKKSIERIERGEFKSALADSDKTAGERRRIKAPRPRASLSEVFNDFANACGSILRWDFLKKTEE